MYKGKKGSGVQGNTGFRCTREQRVQVYKGAKGSGFRGINGNLQCLSTSGWGLNLQI